MLQRMAVYLKSDNTRGYFPTNIYEPDYRVAARARRRGGRLINIMDSRYNPRRRDELVNAWLNGATIEELDRIHEARVNDG